MSVPIVLEEWVALVALGVVAVSTFWVRREAAELVTEGAAGLDLRRRRVYTLGYMFLENLLPFDRRKLRLVHGEGGTGGSSGIGAWISSSGGRSITIF